MLQVPVPRNGHKQIQTDSNPTVFVNFLEMTYASM